MPRKKRSQIAELAKDACDQSPLIGAFRPDFRLRRLPLASADGKEAEGAPHEIVDHVLSIVSAVGIAWAQSEEGVANF